MIRICVVFFTLKIATNTETVEIFTFDRLRKIFGGFPQELCLNGVLY